MNPEWPAATVTATFFHKVKRARDEDNAIASLKAAIDGVADAGLIVNDSGLRWNPPRFEIDKTRPRVELVFAPVAAAPRVVQMTHSAVCECGCQAKGGERGEG